MRKPKATTAKQTSTVIDWSKPIVTERGRDAVLVGVIPNAKTEYSHAVCVTLSDRSEFVYQYTKDGKVQSGEQAYNLRNRPEKLYRPYFKKDLHGKGAFVVVDKSNHVRRVVIAIYNDGVQLGGLDAPISFDDLLRDYETEDGARAGVFLLD